MGEQLTALETGDRFGDAMGHITPPETVGGTLLFNLQWSMVLPVVMFVCVHYTTVQYFNKVLNDENSDIPIHFS